MWGEGGVGQAAHSEWQDTLGYLQPWGGGRGQLHPQVGGRGGKGGKLPRVQDKLVNWSPMLNLLTEASHGSYKVFDKKFPDISLTHSNFP